MSDNAVKRAVTNGVSEGSVLTINSVGTNGQALWRDCLAIVGGVTAVGQVDGGTSRKMMPEREAVTLESLDILQKGEAWSGA